MHARRNISISLCVSVQRCMRASLRGCLASADRRALLAALPLPEALEPPAATAADVAECCVLYPPEQTPSKGDSSGYLRLMLSLVKPRVWKPVPASSLSEVRRGTPSFALQKRFV